MSFTAQVKDELSRVEAPSQEVELAELSALVRVCGTLSFHGKKRDGVGRRSIDATLARGSSKRSGPFACAEQAGLVRILPELRDKTAGRAIRAAQNVH